MSAQVLKGPWGRRLPRVAFWEPLWEELCRTAELPSPAQEKVIAELIGEIQQLADRLKLSPIRMPAGWLRGFVMQANPDLWPPGDSQQWNTILFLLKERKKQLQKMERRELSLVSRPQIRKIRWLLARDPFRDEAWLYAYVGENFPQAKREKGGKQRASLSSLTLAEASHLIDLLQGQAPARHRKRRRA
ncbi:MAG: hypothetical protein K9K65_06075 [Desulfarculaceae bacterium]|nr:hypothetical protein [Desulfarculaceae bacterium]MCF8097393.1 hypothetical protein [Desulfarculaceae bacterium]MCF8123817.1 hypothetical protein [Desulfarculaceae bacterium]